MDGASAMRRKDREVTDVAEKLEILASSKFCHLAMSDNGEPYVVPMNFGYEFTGGRLTLHLHGAAAGRKIDILRQNPRACFEVTRDNDSIIGATACSHSHAFECVIGAGTVKFVDDSAEKTRSLNILMRHQKGMDVRFEFDDKQLAAIAVFRVTADWFTGKRRPRPAPPTR